MRYNTGLNIFTASLGKYYKNYWFNLRSYLTPEDVSFSSAYFFEMRRYFGDPESFLALKLGYGTSPDDNLTISELDYLTAKNLMVGGNHLLTPQWNLDWKIRLENDEIRPGGYQKNCSFELGASFKF